MVIIEMMPAHHTSGARGLAMETKMPLVPCIRATVCPQGWVLVPAIILRLLLACDPTFRCGLRAVVVSAEDLEHYGDVFLVLYRVTYVAFYPCSVRSRTASGEDAFAHLLGDGKVRYPVAVDVPDLALTTMERDGAKPARSRGDAGPAENLLLNGYHVAVHDFSLPGGFDDALRSTAPFFRQLNF
jgi:hypothetical protein